MSPDPQPPTKKQYNKVSYLVPRPFNCHRSAGGEKGINVFYDITKGPFSNALGEHTSSEKRTKCQDGCFLFPGEVGLHCTEPLRKLQLHMWNKTKKTFSYIM